MELKYIEKIITDIVNIEKVLWIPMHRTNILELQGMDLDSLIKYYNKIIHVRDNPV